MITIDSRVIDEIKRRIPSRLDETIAYKNELTGKEEHKPFGNDHEFTMKIPAWVLRAIKWQT
jgi:hypothetical protein